MAERTAVPAQTAAALHLAPVSAPKSGDRRLLEAKAGLLVHKVSDSCLGEVQFQQLAPRAGKSGC